MTIKYTKELIDKMLLLYSQEVPVEEIALALSTEDNQITKNSVIAKLSSLGVYKSKQYLNKQGEVPVRKSEYIERIAELLKVNAEIVESLEKVNKNVLALLQKALES